MISCDLLIRNASLLDGTGAPAVAADLAVHEGRILDLGSALPVRATQTIDANGLTLAPGFIDVHTHDDTAVLRTPRMLPKISQGVTTVITGNCGISAAPVTLRTALPPDPMNLLGGADVFTFPRFADYVAAIAAAQPAVNVAALVGHTALRSNHMDALDREATPAEIAAMRVQLQDALDHGALGLSTGLAYLSANAATTQEVIALAAPLARAGALYTTHMRTETAAILEAIAESVTIGRQSAVPVVISHLKCAGIDNWGRAPEILAAVDAARATHPVGCDCYPYAAGSSTLDLRQVDPRVTITITWSSPHPEQAGRTLAQIAGDWQLPQHEAAARLQPAGAIYHSISEDDMRRILAHPATMIGSDGLPPAPDDAAPHPHPRLWGTFPRVLGRYCRELALFSLPQAIHRMTGLPARRFQLANRGLLRESFAADLVLFDPATIADRATFESPQQTSAGIHAVWVNGVLSYTPEGPTTRRAGVFLPRSPRQPLPHGALF